MFFGMKPNQALSDLIREVKSNSSKWINEKEFMWKKFSWQAGFGAFSYGHSQLHDVISYIMKQKTHHNKVNFKDEHLIFLRKFDVEFKNEYVFNFFDQ